MNPGRLTMSVVQLRRNHAGLLIHLGVNFFEVAKAYCVSPRVLLVWIQHEGEKWENDPYVGREPGPDESYSGEWPTLDQELGAYLRLGLRPGDIPDQVLSLKYKKYRQRLSAEARARKASTAS